MKSQSSEKLQSSLINLCVHSMKYCVHSAALVCSGGWEKMVHDGFCVLCGYLLMDYSFNIMQLID
jgi:hypothetical protein